jgi:hypothetical protein
MKSDEIGLENVFLEIMIMKIVRALQNSHAIENFIRSQNLSLLGREIIHQLSSQENIISSQNKSVLGSSNFENYFAIPRI